MTYANTARFICANGHVTHAENAPAQCPQCGASVSESLRG